MKKVFIFVVALFPMIVDHKSSASTRTAMAPTACLRPTHGMSVLLYVALSVVGGHSIETHFSLFPQLQSIGFARVPVV